MATEDESPAKQPKAEISGFHMRIKNNYGYLTKTPMDFVE